MTRKRSLSSRRRSSAQSWQCVQDCWYCAVPDPREEGHPRARAQALPGGARKVITDAMGGSRLAPYGLGGTIIALNTPECPRALLQLRMGGGIVEHAITEAGYTNLGIQASLRAAQAALVAPC
ncbi:unnamed protein product [Prorocentrum cordatum]|uniref:Uncharacterized protein n=1 Tax=Prorocentrum cordatum TaxID=2364126 RepID=A0ABN9U9P9_9DINO|nr:unnamed protein product [Polarella glacialis]